MAYSRIVISSGHGKYVRGACGILDEVDEARTLVDCLGDELRGRGVDVVTFHDDTSKSQSENLNTIVAFHNKQSRELDISVHFNAYEQVSKPMGTEVLYLTQKVLAAHLSCAIAASGKLIDRGAKKRTDLAFLNGTNMPAVLLEVCFVDSEADASLYLAHCSDIIIAIADTLSDTDTVKPPAQTAGFCATGKCSYFGGPEDMGVDADEGLAFIESTDDAPHLFLPVHDDWADMGLARRLNPFVHYVACRWDYDVTPKASLLEGVALVRALKTGRELTAFPADWGPHQDTGRVADLSPGLMADLGLETDDEVEIVFPWKTTTS